MIMNVYFDNAASTQLDPRVLEKMLPYLKENFGNPSSIHSFGRKVRVAVESARETVASSLNASPGEIYFVSGGTESNNFALMGMAKTEFAESGKNKILTTEAEHKCILEPLEELQKYGFLSLQLPVNSDSLLADSELKMHLDPQTALVSVIHCNNETGAMNDTSHIARLVHANGSLFHTDAVQSFGKIRIDVRSLGADSVSVSSHKIGGPKGAGALYAKSGTPLSPIIFGGSQERNRRGGTENPAAIIGFAEAVKIAEKEMDSNFEIVSGLRNSFVKGLQDMDSKGILINEAPGGLPYILSVTFRYEYYNNDAEAILMYLDLNGIAASNGAACTSGTLKPSHVILAMGKPLEDAQGTIRFSFSASNTLQEIEYALDIIEKMTKKFRRT